MNRLFFEGCQKLNVDVNENMFIRVSADHFSGVYNVHLTVACEVFAISLIVH